MKECCTNKKRFNLNDVFVCESCFLLATKSNKCNCDCCNSKERPYYISVGTLILCDLCFCLLKKVDNYDN